MIKAENYNQQRQAEQRMIQSYKSQDLGPPNKQEPQGGMLPEDKEYKQQKYKVVIPAMFMLQKQGTK